MTHQELRKKFIDFFLSKKHTEIPSAPLVPANDPTVLFTTAGMHPLVPYLLGEPHPSGKRLVSVQKCIRTGDIDEVGDDVHNTFFEMLGNWSLGDYDKNEAIKWSFEFLTDSKWLNIPINRLAMSCFIGDENVPRDDEAANMWRSLGISDGRIAFLGRENNWWGPAGQTGPCGPDTEMFYWTSDESAPEKFNPSDSRWVEIWNDVFMQYRQTETENYEKLLAPNVDTGMGLERTLMVLNGKHSIYETELFSPLIATLESCVTSKNENSEHHIRVITDHMRASAFIIADGVVPSNKDRGYVLRRLLRRSMVFAKQLGMASVWHTKYLESLRTILGDVYPEIKSQEIEKVIADEFHKFEMTLDKGLKEFEKLSNIDGESAFQLYQTYGFPWELTYELAQAKGLNPSRADFEQAFAKHKDLSRTASAGMFKGGLADNSDIVIRYHTATHLLNRALHIVLGDHIIQRGSNITAERTRFDFSHPQKITSDELKRIEDMVNKWISDDYPVVRDVMSHEQALKLGASGAFGEKYGDTVSVYTIANPTTGEIISREFCGGPHVTHTGEIGKFHIIKEESASAGIRRIRAVID